MKPGETSWALGDTDPPTRTTSELHPPRLRRTRALELSTGETSCRGSPEPAPVFSLCALKTKLNFQHT